jgi:Glycosyl transferases group 1
MSEFRVLYILKQFPQLSETYVKTEIEAIQGECSVFVVGMAEADLPYKNHARYRIESDWDRITKLIREFRPHVLHSHWLYNLWIVDYFARKTNTPFTIRAHSFDVLIDPVEHFKDAAHMINDELCLGVLTFPFGRAALEKAGIYPDKLHDCWPVIHYDRFHDRSPNGDAIMNLGACLPKKGMEDFLELAARTPSKQFDLYAMGYDVAELQRRNERMQNPVRIMPAIQPENMPQECKKHRWLVYTAARKQGAAPSVSLGTVGWPMAIAEAQAAGVGVCMANIRPDLREYVGEAGYLFDSPAEAMEIISNPFPEEKRQLGFEHAKKSDVFRHKPILTDLWQKVWALRPELAAV